MLQYINGDQHEVHGRLSLAGVRGARTRARFELRRAVRAAGFAGRERAEAGRDLPDRRARAAAPASGLSNTRALPRSYCCSCCSCKATRRRCCAKRWPASAAVRAAILRRERRAGEPPSELWDALAEGVPRRQHPRGVRRRRARDAAGCWVAEEMPAAGSLLMLVVSPAIVGTILVAPRHGRAEGALAARHRGAAPRRSRSRSPSPTPAPTPTSSRPSCAANGDRYLLRGQKIFISGVEDADAVLVVARLRGDDGELGGSVAVHRRRRRAGLHARAHPDGRQGRRRQWTLFFDDVELEEERLIGGENGGLGVVFDGLNPERIMGASICQRGRAPGARQGAAYAREREVWGGRSARTRASRTRWRRRRSSSSWRG